jgi:hypothetical protein
VTRRSADIHAVKTKFAQFESAVDHFRVTDNIRAVQTRLTKAQFESAVEHFRRVFDDPDYHKKNPYPNLSSELREKVLLEAGRRAAPGSFEDLINGND